MLLNKGNIVLGVIWTVLVEHTFSKGIAIKHKVQQFLPISYHYEVIILCCLKIKFSL